MEKETNRQTRKNGERPKEKIKKSCHIIQEKIRTNLAYYKNVQVCDQERD